MPLAMVRRMTLAALCCVLAAITAVIVRDDPSLALAGPSSLTLAAELAIGALLVLPALTAAGAGRFAAVLAAAGLAWLIGEWDTPAAGAAFTAGLVLSAAWPALLAAAALRGPDERPLGRAGLAVIAAAGLTNLGVLGVLSAAVFDPRGQGCALCPANRLLISGDRALSHHLGQAGLAMGLAWAAAFTFVAAWRLARSTPVRRRVAAPVLVPAVAAVALFAADALHGLARGYLSSDPTDRGLHLAQIATLALVAAGVAWGHLRAGRTRRRLAGLVIELGASPSPGGLAERLAATFGDPALELLFARDGGWVDANGRPASLASRTGREITRLAVAGEEVCALIHRPGLLDDSALMDELAAGARLAVEHERLQAVRRADLEELRASRARIVAAADGERRRLERDLHDGAQQRLVALAVGVRLARRRLGRDHPLLERELADSEEQLTLAVDELRDLAQGLFPSVLDEEGLAPALEALAEDDLRLVPGSLTEHRCAASVESAAYYLIAQVLRLALTGNVAVEAHLVDGRLLVDVRTTGAPIDGVPARVHDRIGAVGGTLATTANHLHAELPCAS
jgi:signal transduction histidine kinase